MEGIHPKFILSKRFPVHAAVEQLNLTELERLLTPASDARFHFGRKLNGTDISVLHQACANKLVCSIWEARAVGEIVRVLLQLGAPHADTDAVGQTPLFYAVSHGLGERLVPILLSAGADPNIQRKDDLWSPLHVAAMLGKTEVANKLLQYGADPQLEDYEGRTAEVLAREYRNHTTADIMASPRNKFRPTIPTEWKQLLEAFEQEGDCLILWDNHVDWRAQDGITLLHIAAWTGHLEIFRLFCNDAQGRKLLTISTNAGLTPLSLAIINGQTEIVEEYFQNRVSKKAIYFNSDVIKSTKQTIPHLLFHFAPMVHPKVLLKRKDLTSGVLNAQDIKGNSPLLQCCMRNSRDTLRRLLSSKAAIERNLFELGLRNQYGKTALHYLVNNNDVNNVRLLLNLLTPVNADLALNSLDVNDLTPLEYALRLDHDEVAALLLTHNNAKDKIRVNFLDSGGRSLHHSAAKKGNLTFWTLLSARSDVDPMLRDAEENTAVMLAAEAGQSRIIQDWVKKTKELERLDRQAANIQLVVQNKKGLNLLMLSCCHLPENVIQEFIDTLNLSVCIDQRDKEGKNALLHLCIQEKWRAAESLLKNPSLDEVAMDVHPTDNHGNSALALVLMSKAKVDRQVQNFKAKKDFAEERKAKNELELLNRIVKLLITKERDLHGMNITTGRDVGVKCIRQQMECNRKIRPPVPEEVAQEFLSLYNVVFRPKKKPAPPPEVPPNSNVPETKKSMPVSSFQDKINSIYKDSLSAKNNEKETDLSFLKLAKVEIKPEEKSTFEDIEYEYTDKDKEAEKQRNKDKQTNGILNELTNGIQGKETGAPKEAKNVEVADQSEPSIEELRASWRQKRQQKEEKPSPAMAFDSDSFFDSLLKKHENDQDKPSTGAKSEDEELAERMNEEIVWALQQKMDAEHGSGGPTAENKESKNLTKSSLFDSKPAGGSLSMSLNKSESDLKKESGESKTNESKDQSSTQFSALRNLENKKPKPVENNSIFAPPVTKKKEKIAPKIPEIISKEQEERELKELENAINEEIRWAMEEKKRLEEERNKKLDVNQAPAKDTTVKPAPKAGNNGEEERKRKEKEEQEKKKRLDEERERIERLQREAEELIAKAKSKDNESCETDKTIDKKENVTKINSSNAGSKNTHSTSLLNGSGHDEPMISDSIKEEMQWAREQVKIHSEEANKESKNSAESKRLEILNSINIKAKDESESIKNLGTGLRNTRESLSNKTPSIKERIEQQKKKEEERIKRLQEEKEKIKNLEKLVEDKIKDTKGSLAEGKPAQDTVTPPKSSPETSSKTINGVEIISNNQMDNEGDSPNSNAIPRWKKEKLLREKSKAPEDNLQQPDKDTNVPEEASKGNKSPQITDSDLSHLPRWKREKILREQRQSINSTTAPALDTAQKANKAEISQASPTLSQQPDLNSHGSASANGHDQARLGLGEESSLKSSPQLGLTNGSASEVEQRESSSTDSSPTFKPVPMRRRRRPSCDVVEETQASTIRSLKGTKEKEEASKAISLALNGNGVRSVATEVETRPGYRDASTQTDPVPTRDMAV